MYSEIESAIICDVCGGAKSRTYGKGEDLLVIENVPIVSCPSCGTSYLTSLTLKEIDRIRRDRAAPTFVDRKTVAVTKSVEVARF